LERSRPEKPASLDAPGLTWQRRSSTLGTRWDLYWKAGARLVKRGFKPATARLWFPSEGQDSPTPDEWNGIAAECRALQAQMLTWSGGIVGDAQSMFDGTFGSLIRIYKTDPDSPFRELRYRTRLRYTSNLDALDFAVGELAVAGLTFRDFKRWHAAFRSPDEGKDHERIARAHGLMTMVRIVIAFGKLNSLPDCARLAEVLSGMDFQAPRQRTVFMTLAQVEAFIAEAHRWGKPSLALTQALMFETGLRQKDVIGEWVPIAEPGASDFHWHGKKWIMGIRWSDIDENLILRKVTSKSMRGRRGVETRTGKLEEFDLKAYPLVMRELSYENDRDNRAWPQATKSPDRLAGRNVRSGVRCTSQERERRPGHRQHQFGPLIINENTQRPWGRNYPKMWRKVADAAGLPKTVCNKDSRAGGVTEGRKAGASLEDLRHHAGHSQISMTARYDRNDIETRNKVAQLRVESRRKLDGSEGAPHGQH
jgi:hypothetical protein